MSVPNEIHDLVEQFDKHKKAYQSGQYDELQVITEFIEPFFEILGWDIQNKQSHDDLLPEINHEDVEKLGSKNRSPEYSIRNKGKRLFFIEAKRPAVDLKNDIHPAFQLRRYGWSAKMDISILTDFEEFAVYDCRKKPDKTENAHAARILYIPYTEYVSKWNEIASVFSRDSVKKGALSRFLNPINSKLDEQVDTEFLKEIEHWREKLAKNIAICNPHLNTRDINTAVHRTIDRILFLRICEDRRIEKDPNLFMLLNGDTVYSRLCDLFRKAHEVYNSGLFHFHAEKGRLGKPDTFTLHIEIEDNVLKNIIRRLYYPECPYVFSVLPACVLANVYELFLGKSINLSKTHRAKIEEKPEVKFAGGVSATPGYIVDTILQNTVGEYLKHKTPEDINGHEGGMPLRILDPACGSGPFLITAYQILLDWYLSWYNQNDPEKWARYKSPKLYRSISGSWRLTILERKRILLSHIFGVDADYQAVEATILSLLLKVIEGENQLTLTSQMKRFHERALPDLSQNIKCGNSLVGPDLYKDQVMDGSDSEERMYINAFDWNREFPEKTQTGIFDIVIGNPPYYKINQDNTEPYLLNYYTSKFKTCGKSQIKSLYQIFIEQGLTLQPKVFSFIVPDTLLTSDENRLLREEIISQMKLKKLTVFDHFVFKNKMVGSSIFLLSRFNDSGKTVIERMKKNGIGKVVKEIRIDKSKSIWDASPISQFKKLLDKIGSNPGRLGDFVNLERGISVQDKKKYLHASALGNDVPYLLGSSIEHFKLNIKYYANPCEIIEKSRIGEIINESKISRLLIRRSGNGIQGTYSSNSEIIDSAIYIITSTKIDLYYLLGILNSKLLSFYLQQKWIKNILEYPQITMSQLKQLPIYQMNEFDPQERLHHDKMMKFVKIILALNKQKFTLQTEPERRIIQEQIDEVDHQIDELVYILYRLTQDEKQIVEKRTDEPSLR